VAAESQSPAELPASDPPEADERNLALIKRYQNAIECALEDARPLRKRVDELRRYVRGVQHLAEGEKPDEDEVRANLILGILQTLVPLYYAKDPEIDVSPEEQVEDQSYGALQKFCATLTVVLNRMLIRDGALKRRITRTIPSAMTAGVAWIKLTYQRDYWQDPLAKNRLNDAQDNLAQLRTLTERIERGDADTQAEEARLEQQIAALEAQVDVIRSEGLVLDFVRDDDVLILDDGLTTFSEYPQADEIAHQIWMTCERFEERFGKKPSGTRYGDKRDKSEGEPKGAGHRGKRPQFVRVFEIWSRRDMTIYTMEFGARDWARPPYRPARTGRRWYPFFALFWNELDGQFHPVSDVEQWTGLADEYNAMRTQLAQARRDNKSGFVYRLGGALTDDDVQNIANRPSSGMVGVHTTGSQSPLKDELVPYPTTVIDATAYDTTPVLRDFEQTSGASDASRAAIQKAKTATEAEIQALGMQSRTAYRQDTIEDLIGEMAVHAAQVLLHELTPEQVARVAGPGYVWPSTPSDDVSDLVQVRIKAGSTGKPNRHQEREAWVQIAPQIVQFIDKVLAYRQAGLNEQAEGVIEMLRETLRRFDERIDIGQFFPPLPAVQPPLPQPGVPGVPGGAPGVGPTPLDPAAMAGAFPPPAGEMPAPLPVGA
jgi:hypothetical protein